MKISLFLFLFFISFSGFSQDSSTVIQRELPEIIILSKKNSSRLSRFDLARYRTSARSSVRCNENLGVMIPQGIQKAVFINEIVIPVKRFEHSDNASENFNYTYHLIFPEKAIRDYEIVPKKIERNDKYIKLTVKEVFEATEPVPYFYIFLLPDCKPPAYASPDLFLLTFRLQSRLSYTLKDSQIELLSLRDRDKKKLLEKKVLNWKIRVDYRDENY